MKLPMLNELETTRDLIDVFKGYNHNLRIGEGEFYNMKNLSSDYYPVLSPRKRRGLYAMTINPQGLIQKDADPFLGGGAQNPSLVFHPIRFGIDSHACSRYQAIDLDPSETDLLLGGATGKDTAIGEKFLKLNGFHDTLLCSWDASRPKGSVKKNPAN